MDIATGPARLDVLEKAEKLAREQLAPRAAHYDEAGAHPWESWRDLWESGLLAMTVPVEYGGLGLDMLTYCMVMEKLAGGCPSTAMTSHMHCTVMRFIEALATPQQKAALYHQVVRESKLFGSWGSEPAVSLTRNFLVETTIEPVDGGYLINGVKHFCTMAGAASYYMVWCALNGSADMSTGLVQALVPAASPGWRTTSGWDTLGMRATVSPSVEFHNCFVAQGLILGQPGDGLQVGQVEAFGLGYAAIYLGAAAAALEFATEYCKTAQFKPSLTPLGQDQTIQRHLGEMSIQLEAARSVLYQSASQWAQADVPTRGLLAAKAKFLCTEAALLTTSKAIQVVGGRSAHRTLPLERLFRDVRTATLMPPNVDTMLVNIGKGQLGLSEALFPASQAR